MIREVQKKNNNVRKKLRIFFVTAAVLCILAFLFWEGFKIQTINVKGYDYYTKEQIIDKIITGPLDSNSVILLLKNKYFQKTEIPFVQDIDIEIKDRHTVDITIYEKSLSGCIEYMGEYLYFDKDGVIVESSNEKLEHVLFIEGLNFSKVVLYEKLEIQNEDLFQVILNLTQLINKYDISVDKISFNIEDEVTLYAGKIRFLLGKQEVYDERIARVRDLLPEASKIGPGYFDLRKFDVDQKRIIFHKE